MIAHMGLKDVVHFTSATLAALFHVLNVSIQQVSETAALGRPFFFATQAFPLCFSCGQLLGLLFQVTGQSASRFRCGGDA